MHNSIKELHQIFRLENGLKIFVNSYQHHRITHYDTDGWLDVQNSAHLLRYHITLLRFLLTHEIASNFAFTKIVWSPLLCRSDLCGRPMPLRMPIMKRCNMQRNIRGACYVYTDEDASPSVLVIRFFGFDPRVRI